jgi:hypothetical protein
MSQSEAGGVARLIEVARELECALDENRSDYELSDGKRSRLAIVRQIDGLRPEVERLAQQVGIRKPPTPVSSGPDGWGFDAYSAWLSEVIGFGGALAKRTAIEAASLEALAVPDSAEALRSRRYPEAVVAEARALESAFHAWPELQPYFGSDLVSRALGQTGVVRPRCGGSERDEESYREGLRLICMGALKAFRNPQAHGQPVALTELDATVQVLVLAYLRYIVAQTAAIPS